MSSQWNIKSSYDPTKKFENPKIEKAPQERLAFNFSFLTPDKKYNYEGSKDKKMKLKLLDKIYFLSQKDMIDLLSHDDKYSGLEKLDDSEVNIRINPEFKKKRYDLCEDGFWIFQLNRIGRVIGKKYKNIFYIMSIDTKFKQYDHG
ncbi:hypothetical protein [Lactobacillus gasseri]|jgi:hypothetical protein|uniref:Uncharacterized protein n=1 Tax=Lactobacillus gasseri TaxID=1596 RepID=A0A8A4UWY6_LACGS|nr:hypothetical protein [Lactobacillus gasseri]QTD66340.1 hypothetical protein J3E67_000670 [Lactobacillus gasseri]